jgi:hypothetical protein
LVARLEGEEDMIRTACVAATLCVGSVVSSAAAQEKPFGTAGEIVLTHGFGLSLSHSNFESSRAKGSNSTIQLYPSADVFVLPGLSLGGGPSYSRSWGTYEMGGERVSGSSDQLGGSLRVGYALNLNDRMTLWPGAAVWYSRSWSRSDQPAADDGRAFGGGVAGDLLALFHVTPSFFLGFGPRVMRDFTERSGERMHSTGVQANSFIGGRL